MCGIVGYIGKRNAQEVLIGGLRRLEYRGYDSCGMCVLLENKRTLSVRKLPGKIKNLERSVEKKPLAGSLGIAHCLAPDTLVLLADGSVLPISKMKDNQRVFSFNLKTQKLEPAQAKVTNHKSPQYLYNLRTPFASLKCTAQHRMFVISGDKIAEKKVKDIKKDDSLIVPKNIKIKGRKNQFNPIFIKRYFKITPKANQLIKTRLQGLQLTRAVCASLSGISEAYMDHIMNNDRNFREDELHKLLPFLSIEFTPGHFMPQNTIHGKFITLPTHSSAGLMQILGYLLGDGTVKERCLRFKDLDKEILWVYQDLIKKVFNIQGRVVPLNGTKAWLLEVNSFYLCQWLKENIISREEEFLSKLGQLPQNEISAFLRGIFDAEGSINLKSGQVSLRITNKHLVRISQLLLLKCGILTSFHIENKNVKNWNHSYGIFLNNLYSFKKFKSIIGLSSKIKLIQLNTLILRRKPALKYRDFQNLNIVPQHILEIKKIKSEEELLFDLEVDHPNSNFIANGLVSHNSRWATHGIPNRPNAHPHCDCTGRIALVHNGIIENYEELKEVLLKEGHKFRSQTDTEVLVHLVEKFYRGSLEEAVRAALKQVRGSYAIAVICTDEPEKLVGARLGSPLITSVNENEGFLASDIPALLDYTKEVILLDDEELVVIERGALTVKSLKKGKILNKKKVKITWAAAQAEKEGFTHFMLKEIHEQPKAIRNTLIGRISEKKEEILLPELKPLEKIFASMKKIVIISCGTAWHAGLVGEYILEEYARIPVEVDISSEFRYRNPIIDKNTLVIAITQSGETADTLAGVREAKARGAKILSICNVSGSSIPRESDAVIYTHAGPEIAVASTKAYSCQLAVLYLFTLYLAKLRNTLSCAKIKQFIGELEQIPAAMKKVLANKKVILECVRRYYRSFGFLYLGRSVNFPTALEGALKIKEISYIHAEGYSAGEMKHGPIALINPHLPVVCIAPESSVHEKMLSNIQEIKARRGIVISIATEGDKLIARHSNHVVYIPKVKELFSPLLSVVPLQLLAYYIAAKRGCDVDQPKNLAKSVTVE